MDELISRKALLAEYDRAHIGEPGKARKLIEDAPRVDAIEVVHAEWVWKDGCFHCTNCKQTEDHITKYCHGCGARMMDGGNEDGT